MPNNPAWHHTGALAKIMAACVLDDQYMLLPESLLPDADCENCKHKQNAQGGQCYVFLERPGDKCGQFSRVDE